MGRGHRTGLETPNAPAHRGADRGRGRRCRHCRSSMCSRRHVQRTLSAILYITCTIRADNGQRVSTSTSSIVARCRSRGVDRVPARSERISHHRRRRASVNASGCGRDAAAAVAATHVSMRDGFTMPARGWPSLRRRAADARAAGSPARPAASSARKPSPRLATCPYGH